MSNMRSKLNHDVEMLVKECIEKNNMLQKNDTVLVAVSGGPDSITLLNILYKLKDEYDIKLAVAHVNHMIREQSKYEKIYVEEMCKNLNIDMYYLEKDVVKLSKDTGMSVEQTGRNVRYDFFKKVANKIGANKIAVAHNLDDNVETILMNIIRGTGLKGLTGIEYVSGNIIRPLLDAKKTDILEYSKQNKLEPKIDATNFEDIYFRNKIRLNLITDLKENYNKNIIDNIIRMKDILKEEEEFLESYKDTVIKDSILEKNKNYIIFNFENITKQHLAIKRRCIRSIITLYIGDNEGIELIHIEDILKLLNNNIPKKKYIIGNKFKIEIVKKFVAKISSKNSDF